eukprot:371604-Pelagomonas_calceolata.AAC.2
MASPPEYKPIYINLLNYRREHPQDKIFGAIHNALSSKSTGFSSCHPIYDNRKMHLILKHCHGISLHYYKLMPQQLA